MASLGSLPALAVQKPPDPLENASRLLNIQGGLQQQQIGAVQLQQAQQSQRDTQAMTAALRDWDASKGYDALTSAAIKNGASSNAVFALQQHVLQQRELKTKVATEELALQSQKHDLMLGHIRQLQAMPDDQLSASLIPKVQELVKNGLLTPEEVQQLPDPTNMTPDHIRQSLDIFAKGYMGEKQQNAEEMKRREVAAQELAAQARMKAAGKQPEGETPLGQPRVDQLNKMMEQRYQVLHPNQPLAPFYRVPPDATQKDFDRIDKMMESEEKAKGTQAQLATANAFREGMFTLSQQAADERKEKEGSKWVSWTDESGKSVAGPRSMAKARGAEDIADVPTEQIRNIQDARGVVQLINKRGDGNQADKQGILQLIDSLDKDGKLGIVASRLNSFLAGGVGASPSDDPRIITLMDKGNLAMTLSMKAHFGASGGRSPQMLEHFLGMANAKKMDATTLRAGFKAIGDYMEDRAMQPVQNAPQVKSDPLGLFK